MIEAFHSVVHLKGAFQQLVHFLEAELDYLLLLLLMQQQDDKGSSLTLRDLSLNQRPVEQV